MHGLDSISRTPGVVAGAEANVAARAAEGGVRLRAGARGGHGGYQRQRPVGRPRCSQCLFGFCARFIHIPCTTEIHMCAAQLSADGAEGEAASPGGGLGATSDSAAFLREAASNAAAEVCLYQDRWCFTSHTHTT